MEQDREPGKDFGKGDLWRVKKQGWRAGQGLDRPHVEIRRDLGQAWNRKLILGLGVQEGKSVGQGPGPCKVDALTHEAGDEHTGDPLLPHLLDLGLVSRCNGGAHNGQGIDMGD